MRKRCIMIQKASFAFALIFVISQIFCVAPAISQVTVISGVIEKITPLKNGQFEIVLVEKGKKAKYIVDSSTLIQTIIPAAKVAVGQKIVVPSVGAPVAKPGVKSPFSNIPPKVRKELGLPEIPEVPGTPGIPAIPKVPQVPKVPQAPQAGPSIPQAPKAAGGPNMPRIPQVPKAGVPQPGAAAPAGGGAPVAAGEAPQEEAPNAEAGAAVPSGEMPSAGEEVQKKSEEPEAIEAPSEARSATNKPSAVSVPTPTLPSVEGKKVLSIEKTPEGFKVTLEGEKGIKETQMLPMDSKVLALLNIKDLKQKMAVSLDVVEDAQGKFVQRVMVS